ncbi:nicotinic acid mononucleotide adenylyltransferase [Flavobacterium piscis]|jgi:nicotinate-nucleotide adenylyltransferase|uniref:Probable nicotinate-nucleotide adenylyltransferase n=1 Tax=Flavobacterium piscis TaxID=1114874 RepID=A0ABX2XLS2_9FLAO|nr:MULTISPECIES: nicotinate (nicotinamide) nucleotide adenylyltransferase [Flavobacterium]MBF4486125.1 nicotinate-nucleotide adenylyltransferase [Flavobacterium sp. CSZ]OCB76373.1 nicotinic acid mononucleotide adenylyltransferase [Flavobacterium piscis]OXG06726.1 nicotinic acid mononucleotide adenylyltransferase [Flavobacterium piscis]QGK76488.1 nicotinate-nucleotide adenylyltransferase [Flavobacterium sp. SLB02]
MKIGLYFGTYNPIHVGHLIIANHMAEFADLDQIWMVVTPHNPLKKKSTLLDDHQRLEMVHLATEDYPKIKPSDIEFKLPQPNYTVNTLVHLHEKYPTHDFSLIMGEDNLKTLHKWKNYEVLLEHYEIYVYPRLEDKTQTGETLEEEPNTLKSHPNIHIIDAPIVEISATFIRKSIKEGKNIQPLLPPKVWEYIDHNNFYKK